jgi:hypothetical protein
MVFESYKGHRPSDGNIIDIFTKGWDRFHEHFEFQFDITFDSMLVDLTFDSMLVIYLLFNAMQHY